MNQLYYSEKGYLKQVEQLKQLEAEITQTRTETLELSQNEGNMEENSTSERIDHDMAALYLKANRLRSELQNTMIVSYPKSVDAVCIGCTVDVKIDGQIGRYHILGHGETDIRNNKLAYNTPIAQALLHKKPGFVDGIKVCNSYKKIEVLDVFPLKED